MKNPSKTSRRSFLKQSLFAGSAAVISMGLTGCGNPTQDAAVAAERAACVAGTLPATCHAIGNSQILKCNSATLNAQISCGDCPRDSGVEGCYNIA